MFGETPEYLDHEFIEGMYSAVLQSDRAIENNTDG